MPTTNSESDLEPLAELPRLATTGHATHCKMCLAGLPAGQVDIDSSRLALVFYCLGSLDLLDIINNKTNNDERQMWVSWVWEQQTSGPYGSGFKPGPYMTPEKHLGVPDNDYSNDNSPHIIVTYTALLCLAILRDDFTRLDRSGLIKFLRSCQKDDGSFSTEPLGGDSDLRTVYCAFAISSMLDDWSGVNVDRAFGFIASCRSYEGGYGQSPFCEAQGGTTYCALASMHLANRSFLLIEHLSASERRNTIRWLIQNQDGSGGFCGRTGKDADACYCFWCGASLSILGVGELVNTSALARFVASCQFKFGGIAKAPGEHPDPFHTYLALAALSLHPPQQDVSAPSSWILQALDPLLNTKQDTAAWARQHIPAPGN
ncbi:hypothetical protein SERLA73DRAFT_183095 [Serpula lacrymans var. lacrymans S7.3]|uniref:Prenyltransferase alpha-alpha toroid domain-containing protein n=2 Tax=Serpula lacrymans var. lacrymans TaxID=341189 RepID=F8Q1K7_SERL3|nr:uncharacterized protein SERLADRAFT_470083 [Serpula lacrymans var. lacrymans S7.9]EGN98185.1 hypothetical protein SERLA73DRAFT_183095 [Serpula lacrymans var. lacrymans S7.3]EGO23762.1 hypothetical protein SERLADRAFT_470083 [Serpula lacrymans var. lacrymans S7.9]